MDSASRRRTARHYLKSFADAHPDFVRPNVAQLDRLEPWVSYPGPNYQQIRQFPRGALLGGILGQDEQCRAGVGGHGRGVAEARHGCGGRLPLDRSGLEYRVLQGGRRQQHAAVAAQEGILRVVPGQVRQCVRPGLGDLLQAGERVDRLGVGPGEGLAVLREQPATRGADDAGKAPVTTCGPVEAADIDAATRAGHLRDGCRGCGDLLPRLRRLGGIEAGITEQVGVDEQHRCREHVRNPVCGAADVSEHRGPWRVGVRPVGEQLLHLGAAHELVERLCAEVACGVAEVREGQLADVGWVAGDDLALDALCDLVRPALRRHGIDMDVGVLALELGDQFFRGVTEDPCAGEVVALPADGDLLTGRQLRDD